MDFLTFIRSIKNILGDNFYRLAPARKLIQVGNVASGTSLNLKQFYFYELIARGGDVTIYAPSNAQVPAGSCTLKENEVLTFYNEDKVKITFSLGSATLDFREYEP